MLGPLTYGAVSQVSAVPPWYLSGGAPAPIARYELKGAASQAAAQVNLQNPGTFDLTAGVAPTWDATNGLIFNGTTQYLTTGIIPTSTYTALVRVSNVSTANQIIFGSVNALVTAYFGLPTFNNFLYIGYGNNASTNVAYTGGGGVFGMAANKLYINGSNVATGPGTFSGTPLQLYVGARNNAGTADRFAAVRFQYIVVWDTDVGHATWMPAVSAAVSAL